MLTPSRLAIARKRRGLTLTRLAELTGLSTHSLSTYENGHQTPSEEKFLLLADALGVSPTFLSAPDVDEIPADAASFRALSKMTARQRDRALSVGRIALLINDWIDARFHLPAADIPSLTGHDPEPAAEVVRARWGLGERPIANMLHLLEAHGVRIYSLTAENNELDAYSLYWHAQPFIFLSTRKSGERGRFDAAHEFGHLVLHGEYQTLNRPAAEMEANRFAAAFLMPRASILAQGLRDVTPAQILQAKRTWKVAAMALTHRLHELDLLTEWGYRTACVQLSRLGYRSREPNGIQRESSQLLGKVFRSVREDGSTPATIAADIGITPDELQDHVFGLTLTTVTGDRRVAARTVQGPLYLVRPTEEEMIRYIQLGSEWQLSEQIGGGGFGQVYAAKSTDCDSAVAKLVPKAPGAERELLFADDLTGVRNVVPIIDQGETEDSWVLVMPRAEKSLRQYLNEVAGPVGTAETVTVLSDIAAALADLDGHVVHRDLKPENVLLLDGHWCLADFGISRYAEATTAADTRKYSWSKAYAAPEQWRYERATTATDIYALGVIAYELLSGSLPFTGPDFRDQHLNRSPAQLSGVPAALGALAEECLNKPPEARPSPRTILDQVARAAEAAPSDGLAKLQEANRANVIRRGEIGRQASALRSERERRDALAGAATQSLTRVATALKEAIMANAPSASLSKGLEVGWTIQLQDVELRFAPPQTTSPSPWGSRVVPAFEVIAFSALSLQIPAGSDGYEGRSHSLWYCDAQEARRYQWFETAFMIPVLVRARTRQNPFALNPGEDSAGAVASGWPDKAQVAWPFTPVSTSELAELIGRWAGWFADAAQGTLRRPNPMPERSPRGSWRQS